MILTLPCQARPHHNPVKRVKMNYRHSDTNKYLTRYRRKNAGATRKIVPHIVQFVVPWAWQTFLIVTTIYSRYMYRSTDMVLQRSQTQVGIPIDAVNILIIFPNLMGAIMGDCAENET